MADTRTQRLIADWLREEWLPSQLSERFVHRGVSLSTGGEYRFDAVSASGGTVVSLSTSRARTAGGKLGVGKLTKVRADMLFLLLANANRRVVVLTDAEMYEQFEKERKLGRVPPNIEIRFAELPERLAAPLAEAQSRASAEVRPGRG